MLLVETAHSAIVITCLAIESVLQGHKCTALIRVNSDLQEKGKETTRSVLQMGLVEGLFFQVHQVTIGRHHLLAGQACQFFIENGSIISVSMGTKSDMKQADACASSLASKKHLMLPYTRTTHQYQSRMHQYQSRMHQYQSSIKAFKCFDQ